MVKGRSPQSTGWRRGLVAKLGEARLGAVKVGVVKVGFARWGGGATRLVLVMVIFCLDTLSFTINIPNSTPRFRLGPAYR